MGIKLCLIYVTTPNPKTAQTIARALVRDKLVACANIFGPIKSIYEWKGSIETSKESVLILKTRQSLFEAARKRIVALHPYECPCVMQLALGPGHAPYVDWLLNQTRP